MIVKMDLKSIRGDRTLEQVANELGCSIATVWRAEKGHRISETLRRWIEEWARKQGKRVTWRNGSCR